MVTNDKSDPSGRTMKITGLMFKAEMIRAYLREIEKPGTGKTQTRRLVQGKVLEWLEQPVGFTPEFVAKPENRLCRYGYAGDLIYAKEAWIEDASGIHLRATEPDFPAPELGGWRSYMFMPRWASRITIQLTEVRIERLQDISAEDAMAEGITGEELFRAQGYAPLAYRRLWESINGRGSWDANPWVWVLTGKPHLVNVNEFVRRREELSK
jgi:hypothetical protein